MNTNEHTVSMETRRKISKSMKGRSNFKGKHHTPDSIESNLVRLQIKTLDKLKFQALHLTLHVI